MPIFVLAACLGLVTDVSAHSATSKQRLFLDLGSPSTGDVLQHEPKLFLQGSENWPSLVMNFKSDDDKDLEDKKGKNDEQGKMDRKGNQDLSKDGPNVTMSDAKDAKEMKAVYDKKKKMNVTKTNEKFKDEPSQTMSFKSADDKDDKDDKDKKGKKKGKGKKKKDKKDKSEDENFCKECPKTTPVWTTTVGVAVLFTTTPPAPTAPATTAPITSAPTTTLPSTSTAAPVVVVSPICATALSCAQCTALPECGWCAVEGRCVGGNKLAPHNIQCGGYQFNHCSIGACHARNTCDSCLENAQCGWCGVTSTCVRGDTTGPLMSSDCHASADEWSMVWTHTSHPEKCDAAKDYHGDTLWGSLQSIMETSQARVTAFATGTVPPIVLPPTTPPPTSPPPPTRFPTTWVPVFPTTVTTTTTKKKKKKTTPAPTTTTFLTTTPLPTPAKCREKPTTVVDVDVCQNCKPPGEEEGGDGGGGNETAPPEEASAPPPPAFLQNVNRKRQQLHYTLCCFLHPDCCLPDCPDKSA